MRSSHCFTIILVATLGLAHTAWAQSQAMVEAAGASTPFIDRSVDPPGMPGFSAFLARESEAARAKLEPLIAKKWVSALNAKKRSVTVDTTFFNSMSLDKREEFVRLVESFFSGNQVLIYDARHRLIASDSIQFGLHVEGATPPR